MNDDVDVAPEFRQAIHELPLRYSTKLPSQDPRQLRLRHAKDVCGLGLRVAALREDLRDLGDELRLDEHTLGIANAKVGIYVSTAGFMIWRCLALAALLHCLALLTSASANRSRSLIMSMSALGVAIPVIGLLLSFVGMIYSLYLLYTTSQSPKRQGFHDVKAGTVVVKHG